MAVDVKRRLFTVDEYYKMAEAGIFTEDDRVELLAGEIVMMGPLESQRSGTGMFLSDFFSSRLVRKAIISPRLPVRLSDYSEVQPDIALLRFRADFFRKSHPGPQDVYLLVEVGDASIAYAWEVRKRLYALVGIPEVWLVDLQAEHIEVYRKPSGQGYADVRILGRGSEVTPAAFPDVTVRVDEVLG